MIPSSEGGVTRRAIYCALSSAYQEYRGVECYRDADMKLFTAYPSVTAQTCCAKKRATVYTLLKARVFDHFLGIYLGNRYRHDTIHTQSQ